MSEQSNDLNIDYQSAIKRLQGNYSTYLKLIDIFIESYTNVPKQVELAVDNNNLSELKKVAHNLKSSASYIGATKLYQLSDAIEVALINKENNKALNIVNSLVDQFNQVVDDLDTVQEHVKSLQNLAK